jgi:hypothetical protein
LSSIADVITQITSLLAGHMIVSEHSTNYRSALRLKRSAGRVPEKIDQISRKKRLGYGK